jgi:hypothetical protein
MVIDGGEVVPAKTDVAQVRYELNQDGRAIVTDGGVFSLNITEFGAFR